MVGWDAEDWKGGRDCGVQMEKRDRDGKLG